MMGKAGKAPEPMYARQLMIGHKALMNFREMLGQDYIHRPDGDVKNLLDEMVSKQPAPLHVVTDINHSDELTRVYPIDVNGGTRYAVVRDGRIVTLLGAVMVEKNLRDGSWVHATDNALAPEPKAPSKPIKQELKAVPAAAPLAAANDRDELHVDISLPLAQQGVKVVEAQLRVHRARLAASKAVQELKDAEHNLDNVMAAMGQACGQAVANGTDK